MTEPSPLPRPPKASAEAARLATAAPHPRRLRRGPVLGVVIALCGLALLAFALAVSKQPETLAREAEVPVPADLSVEPPILRGAPHTYADIPQPPPPEPPVLGPPLAGDLAQAGVPAPPPSFATPPPPAPRAHTTAADTALAQALEGPILLDVDLSEPGRTRTPSAPGAAPPAALGGPTEPQPSAPGPAATPFSQGAGGASAFAVAGRLTPAGSPYEVKAGSVIPCTLIRGINSDLPGDTLCHVRQNVFDTVTGDYLLIPQGTRAIGEYDSATNFGISRVLTVWHRLVFPNGKSIALEGMPGVDLSGYAGYKDRVNQHWGKLTASVILSTIFSAAPVIAAGDVENYQATVDQEIARNVGANINQAGQQIVERSLSVKPTIEIRPGFAVNIFVQKDLPLEPYESTIRGELSLGTHHPTNEGG